VVPAATILPFVMIHGPQDVRDPERPIVKGTGKEIISYLRLYFKRRGWLRSV
jgi:hypothetical protein